MFGKQAYELLQEVAQCPADNLPPFNVSITRVSKRCPLTWLLCGFGIIGCFSYRRKSCFAL
jgi:hypothetical protein